MDDCCSFSTPSRQVNSLQHSAKKSLAPFNRKRRSTEQCNNSSSHLFSNFIKPIEKEKLTLTTDSFVKRRRYSDDSEIVVVNEKEASAPLLNELNTYEPTSTPTKTESIFTLTQQSISTDYFFLTRNHTPQIKKNVYNYDENSVQNEKNSSSAIKKIFAETQQKDDCTQVIETTPIKKKNSFCCDTSLSPTLHCQTTPSNKNQKLSNFLQCDDCYSRDILEEDFHSESCSPPCNYGDTCQQQNHLYTQHGYSPVKIIQNYLAAIHVSNKDVKKKSTEILFEDMATPPLYLTTSDHNDHAEVYNDEEEEEEGVEEEEEKEHYYNSRLVRRLPCSEQTPDSSFRLPCVSNNSPRLLIQCSSSSSSVDESHIFCSPPETPKIFDTQILKTPQAPLRPNRTRKTLLAGITYGNISITEEALNLGEDPNMELYFSSYNLFRNNLLLCNNSPPIRLLPLLAAASLLHFPIIKTLLEHGVVINSVNANGQTAAHLVCSYRIHNNNDNGFAPVLNNDEKNISETTKSTMIPHHWLEFKDYLDQEIPSSGSSTTDDDNTNDDEKICNGEDDFIPQPIVHKKTALENYEVSQGHDSSVLNSIEFNILEILKLLVKYDINLSIKDTFGKLAIDYARLSHYTHVELFLSKDCEQQKKMLIIPTARDFCLPIQFNQTITTKLPSFPKHYEKSNHFKRSQKKNTCMIESITPSIKHSKIKHKRCFKNHAEKCHDFTHSPQGGEIITKQQQQNSMMFTTTAQHNNYFPE